MLADLGFKAEQGWEGNEQCRHKGPGAVPGDVWVKGRASQV